MSSIASPRLKSNSQLASFIPLREVSSRLFPDDGVACRATAKLAEKFRDKDGNLTQRLRTLGGIPGREITACEHIATSDFYWTPNEFLVFPNRGKRRNGLLRLMGLTEKYIARLQAIVIDIDTHKVTSKPPAEQLPEILASLAESTVPLPHFAVLSGRGLHLYWLHTPSHREGREEQFWADVSLWRTACRRLCGHLSRFGCDRAASLRIGGFFRVPGTVNSSAPDALVGAVEILPADAPRYTLEQLVSDIPLLEVARAKRGEEADGVKGRCPDPSNTKSLRALRDARRTDLSTLIEDRIQRHFNWHGMRNKLCFYWGQIFKVDLDRATLLELNARLHVEGEEPDNETNIRHVSVPHFDEAGRIKHLYRLSNSRIIADLEITDEEMQRLKLLTLISPRVKWLRRRMKQRSRPDGRLARTERSLRLIQQAIDQGAKTKEEISQATGISRAQVYRLLNDKQTSQPAKPRPRAASVESKAASVSFSTRLSRPPRAGDGGKALIEPRFLAWNFDPSQPTALSATPKGLELRQSSTRSLWILPPDSPEDARSTVEALFGCPGAEFHCSDSMAVLRHLHREQILRPAIIHDTTIALGLLGTPELKRGKGDSTPSASRAWEEIKLELEQEGLLEAYLHREIIARDLAFEMEIEGIPLDTERAKRDQKKLQAILADIEAQVHQIVGFPLNLSDEAKVARTLRNLFPSLASARKNGRPTCDHKALRTLENGQILSSLIARHRTIRTVLKGSLAGILNAVGDDHRVRGVFSVTDTITGRLSCRNPNLLGMAKGEIEGASVRKSIRTSTGFSFVRGDYRQFDLNILAQASGCKPLLRILQNGGDLYLQIAREMFRDVHPDDLESMRDAAKSICYLIFYGGQAPSLARTLNVSIEQAQFYLDSFQEAFPEIHTFEQSLIEEAKQCGYVRTLGGRRRYLRNLTSNKEQLRRSDERKVLATFIQGTAAEITKDAMIRIAEEMTASPNGEAKLVLQVHDELVLEIPREEEIQWADALRFAMQEAALDTGFPVPVRISAGCDLA